MENPAQVFGLPFSNLTLAEALDRCEAMIEQQTPRHLMTANVDFLGCCERNPDQRKLILGGAEVLCDGMPLVWASRLFGGSPLPQRVAGSDLVPRLLERCAKRGFSVYFFGSDAKTLSTLQTKLSNDLPALKIAGATCPPVDSIDNWDNQAFIDEIREARPDILMVALGFPKQDEWIRRFTDSLSVPLSMGIGASLDFIAGKQRRAPRWMQRTGTEWLWRLATDPRRLTGRYLRDFVSLGRITATQIAWEAYRRLPVLFPRKVERSALLNGVRLDDVHVTAFECDGTRKESGPKNPRALVCDLSGIETASPEHTVEFIQLACRAIRKKIPLVFYNPSSRLRFWLRHFGMAQLFPVLESPLAINAFFGRKKRGLPVPYTGDSRRREAFVAAALEVGLASDLLGPDPVIAKIDESGGVNRQMIRWLAGVQTSVRSSGVRLKLEGISPVSADLVTIFGGREILK